MGCPVADDHRVTTLVVSRWTKYGKDRLYVSTADGVRVGWQDLRTGLVTVERPDLAELLNEALATHSAFVGEPDQPPAHLDKGAALPPPETATPDTVGASWDDLARNRPGQGVRTQADAALAAMKDRSRLGTFLTRAFDVKTDERAWRVGADGEESIGARLDRLTKHGWYVLHSVPVGTRGSDIDHVLIGPGGVYTLNTKNHPGGVVWVGQHAIKVNGTTVPYLRNSRFEAGRAEKLLTAIVGWPVIVRPVLVFLTGTLVPNVTIKQQPDGVLILDRTDIPGAFKRAASRLTADQLDQVFEKARRSTTWTHSR